LEAVKKVDDQIVAIKSWLEANENRDKTNVDDLVFLKATWSSQMFDLVAADSAIEDTLYQLDRALGDERIELTNFLKEVRKLAHKQFMARALAVKVVERQREEYTKGTYANSPQPSSAATQARLAVPGGPWPQSSQVPYQHLQAFVPQQQFQQPYAQQPVLVGGYPGRR